LDLGQQRLESPARTAAALRRTATGLTNNVVIPGIGNRNNVNNANSLNDDNGSSRVSSSSSSSSIYPPARTSIYQSSSETESKSSSSNSNNKPSAWCICGEDLLRDVRARADHIFDLLITALIGNLLMITGGIFTLMACLHGDVALPREARLAQLGGLM
jgi:hypothetical protein